MIKLIDLERWSDYTTSPYINQLKQLSIQPEITPTKRQIQNKLSSLQQKKLEYNQINNYKSMNRKQTGHQIMSEERKSQKSTKKYIRIPLQQYQFHELSSFIESQNRSKKIKEQQDSLFQKKTYRLKIKNKILNLTQKSPLLKLSQLLSRLNNQDIDKNELLQMLNK